MDARIALQSLAELRDRLEGLDRDRYHLLAERRDMIKAALAAGATRTAIAAEAGISRQRVVQVEEGRWR